MKKMKLFESLQRTLQVHPNTPLILGKGRPRPLRGRGKGRKEGLRISSQILLAISLLCLGELLSLSHFSWGFGFGVGVGAQEFSSRSTVKVPGFRGEGELLNALEESEFPTSSSSGEEEDSIQISRSVEPQVLKRLESKFLHLFGMKERPKRGKGKALNVPKYLLELYEKQTGEEMPLATSNLNLPGRNVRTANTVRTFYVKPAQSQSSHFLHFDISSIPESEEVTGAEIRVPFVLQKEEDLPPTFPKVKVLLHDVIRPKTPESSKKPKHLHLKEPITQAIDSKRVSLSRKRNGTSTFYLTFDAFPAVRRWLESQGGQGGKFGRNHGLLIEIQTDLPPSQHKMRVKRDESGVREEVGGVKAVSSSNAHPIVLFTYSDDGHNGRRTRDAKTLSRQYRAAQNQHRRRNGHRRKNKKRNLCARHNMFVDFTDVGWNDWIVAPPGYQAYHCSGECPFPMADYLNATNHAVIQALVNSMNPALVPPPCCVPTKYTALSLLYTDSSDKIVLKNYNEMIVDSCGCS